MVDAVESKVNVLVVDDNEDILRAHSMLLSKLGHNIVMANSGAEALKIAESTELAVVVLDVCMPDLDGLEVAKRMRASERTRTTPIIFATALDRTEANQLKGYDVGAVDFLFKPVDPVVLRSKVRVFIDLALRTREVALQAKQLDEARRREHERELAHQRQLAEAQKLKAVGVLSAGVAHHFNNLLQIMMGHTELAVRMLPADAVTRRFLTTALSAGKRAVDLVRRMMVLGQVKGRSEDRTDLNDAVLENLRTLTPMMPENITIQTRLGADAGRIPVERTELDQIILALLTNARDAMTQGGVLTVETSDVTGTPESPSFNDDDPTPMSRLAVVDTGIGMDGAVRAHLFEPFFTTKGPDRGVGLGLFTAHGIVDRLGGVIRVDSTPAKGSSFAVYLPRADVGVRPASRTAELPKVAKGQPGCAGTVLVVEDDDEVRVLVKSVLETGNYEVFAAASGEEALKRFGDIPDRFDLLLSDIVLPGINGVMLARRFQEQRPEIKVLHMTAHVSIIEERRASLGVTHDVLRKPFTIDALLEAVNKAMAGPSPR